MKIHPLVEAIYGFESSTKPAAQTLNRKLVEDLTEDFGLCYKVCLIVISTIVWLTWTFAATIP